jgi:hypothetical protein
MREVEHVFKKNMELFSPQVEANIMHNGNKGVTNYIMGSYAFIAMSTP